MEVLVAVGIIAIISSIAVTTFQGNKKQAAEVAATTSASNILRAHNACIALNSFDSCDEMSEMGVQCPDCNEGKATNKFCIGVSKSVGADTVKVCVGKAPTGTQRTIGGTLLSGIQLCHVEKKASGGSPSCVAAKVPTSNFKKCENNNNSFCGTDSGTASATTCKTEYSCSAPTGMTGTCSATGDCS